MLLFLFLWVLSDVSVLPMFLLIYYFTHIWDRQALFQSEFLIRTSTDIMDSFCLSPRGFSQLITSFFGSLVPRYSPYALCSLTLFLVFFYLRLWFFSLLPISQCLTLSLFVLLNCHIKNEIYFLYSLPI